MLVLLLNRIVTVQECDAREA